MLVFAAAGDSERAQTDLSLLEQSSLMLPHINSRADIKMEKSYLISQVFRSTLCFSILLSGEKWAGNVTKPLRGFQASSQFS